MASVFLVLLTFLFQSSNPPVHEAVLPGLSDRLAILSGPEAKDCGVIWSNAQEVEFAMAGNCVLDAIDAGESFKFVIRIKDTDFLIAKGLFGNKKGDIYLFDYDDSDKDSSGRSDYELISSRPCSGTCVSEFFRNAIKFSYKSDIKP